MRLREHRLRRLEQQFTTLEHLLVHPRERLRIIVQGMVGPANLADARCSRRLYGGTLMEFVDLNGSRNGLTDDQLEQFIVSHPVELG